MSRYDRIIIGAGIYGLYAASFCGKRGERVLVVEKDSAAFSRATYINQARVHQGYHYPRSLSTAEKSARYFDRFCHDYGFCINQDFKQVYATSACFSWTDAQQFKRFCSAARIPCEEISPTAYFRPGMCDGAFLTQEYTYDAMILRDHMIEELRMMPNVDLQFCAPVTSIEEVGSVWRVATGISVHSAPYVLNATYASSNQIVSRAGFDELFKIKYELCEIILCDTNKSLQETGITVMDGPFFSIMPFGKTGLHSLTSVTFTPHRTSYDALPTFACQGECGRGYCRPGELGNCNECDARPRSAFPYMSSLARKYLQDEFRFKYRESLFSMKPILVSSEIDDSRPTVIKTLARSPWFVSVLSGKINTIFDMDEVLIGG
ncbi:MAG: FAD-dependent oxidoreductase [Adlercreutzia sp.]|nr:FAD-dependent oxidoreductase [Adlercreutzia sp.]